jgi:mono/diheme cytochrome c family protein
MRAIGLALATVGVALAITAAKPAARTYENARAVGKRCSTCHVGKHPGVENLNERGKYYLTHRTLDGYKPGGPARGAAIFARTCAPCHGAKGEGAPLGRPLVGGNRKYTTPAQVEDVVRHGIKGTAMAPFGTVFGDAEIKDIVQHVLALSAKR